MKKIIILVAILLFLLPFFWFKVGDINIGGDSSRLYFYDPFHYLVNFAVYSIVPSEIGSENIPFALIPLSIFLMITKYVLRSPYLVIIAFYSMMILVATFSVYGIVYELLKKFMYKGTGTFIHVAGLVSGIFYVFNPIVGPNWDKNMYSHQQVFLNPLIFYLLLKYIHTKKLLYGLLAIFISLIFAINFSFSSAPGFFSFFPLAILYLLVYAVFVAKSIPTIKSLTIVVLLVVLVHSFHLIPLVTNLFDSSTDMFGRVFNPQSKEAGLQYFDSARASVRLSRTISGIPPMDNQYFSQYLLSFIFPVILLLGIIINGVHKQIPFRHRINYLVLFSFFLIVLFFQTANITPLITNIYRLLFKVPGFSMFRNYYGQFMYVNYFFYSLILGLSFYYILAFSSKTKRITVISLIVGVVILTSWSFINGNYVNQPFFQGNKDVDGTFKMEPEFDQVLSYFHNSTASGKIIVLPFTDFGYQVLAGKGGYYMGPSIVGYLTGHQDFAGHSTFGDYSTDLQKFSKDSKYKNIRAIFSLFNIRYILHNTDERIYSTDYFPSFPYDGARTALPTSQEDYAIFIKRLGAREIQRFSDKFILYELPKEDYIPTIYAANKITLLSNEDLLFDQTNNSSGNYDQTAIVVDQDNGNGIAASKNIDNFIIKAKNRSPYIELFSPRDFSKYRTPYLQLTSNLTAPPFESPYAMHVPSSLVYPVIVGLEERELSKLKNEGSFDEYYDTAVFFAEKRLAEIERWKNSYSVLGDVKSLEEFNMRWNPSLVNTLMHNNYLSWEVALLRYYRTMSTLISDIESTNNSVFSIPVNKYSLFNRMLINRNIVAIYIYQVNLKAEQKQYLQRISEEMFSNLLTKVMPTIPEVSSIKYEIDPPVAGSYEVYLDKKGIQNFNPEDFMLTANNSTLVPLSEQKMSNWISYDLVDIPTDLPITFGFSYLTNLDSTHVSSSWQSAEKLNINDSQTSLVIKDSKLELSGGVVKEISSWTPSSVYIISFEYNTHSNPFNLTLFEQDSESKEKYQQIFGRKLQSNKWESFSQVIPPGGNEQPRILHLSKDTVPNQGQNQEMLNDDNKIDIREFSIKEIPHPQILLRRLASATKEEAPKITFTKVNPTKYFVDVENAKEPYTLILQEAFSPRWKLYMEPTSTVSLVSIAKAVLPFKSLSVNNTDIQEEYFSGRVVERVPLNKLFYKEIFDTFGQTSIADGTHFKTNGYANGWFISPGDTENKSDYRMVVEMVTQKRFYASLVVSLIGILGLLVLLSYNLAKLLPKRK